MNLSLRLSTIMKKVPKGARIADIGTDHAYLPVALINEGRVNFAIACDINEKPLKNAEKTVRGAGMSDKISLRLSNGLEKVSKDEVDTVIIAGIGGEVISGIIERADWLKCNKLLILQPTTAPEALREYLANNGFFIESETAVEDANKVYTVMTVVSGTETQKDFAYYVTGKIDPRSVSGREYLNKQLRRFSALSESLKGIDSKQKTKADADSAVLKIKQLLEEH